MNVSKEDLLIEEFSQLQVGYLRLLGLHIKQVPHELGDATQSIQVELLDKNLADKFVLSFRGVQMLKISDLHPGVLCHFEVSNVADHQLEGIRYRVFNSEQDLTLSFYCHEFDFLVVQL